MWWASARAAQPSSVQTALLPRAAASSARSSTTKPGALAEGEAAPPTVEGPGAVRIERAERVEAAERDAAERIGRAAEHGVDEAELEPGRTDEHARSRRSSTRSRATARA